MKASSSLLILALCACAVFAQPARSKRQPASIETGSPALNRELTALVNSSRRAPDPVMQRWVVAQPGVKIAVKTEGMYRLTRTELQSAGFPVDSDPANWRLFVNGNEQAIIVGDRGEYIDFYGRGIDAPETDTRIYYLISDTAPGKRMVEKVLNSIGGNVVTNNYRFSAEKKERISYNPNIQNGDVENYFGRVIIYDPYPPVTFQLKGIDPQGPNALIQINLQGLTYMSHNVHVVINGIHFGIVTGNGVNHFNATFVVPQSLLIEGTNSIVLNTLASNDACYFDSIRVNYSRRYAADQSKIQFITPGYRRANVSGFTSPNIRVFDTTLDSDPQFIVNPQIVQEGDTYTVRMPSNRPAVFYAVEDSALLHSPSVTFDAPSTLSSPDNSADMIIISYSSPEFMAAAETWADYRRSQEGGGFNIKVVNIDDVFDEFSYGLHSAQGIKSFLEYVHTNWQFPRPAYVLILGDASYDRRNYEGYGYWDMVPAKNVSLPYDENDSDDAMADFDNDGIADIPIGRIPARTVLDIQTVLNKTISFETAENQSLWRGALFAYDAPYGQDFLAISQMYRSGLPRMPATFVSRLEAMSHQHLIDGINSGKYIVNYSGHAAASIWGSQDFFTAAHIPQLTNAANPSIFTVFSDFNAFFTRPSPNNDCFGEALLKAPNGGAAVTFASTTVITPDVTVIVGSSFYQLLGAGHIPRIGDLVKASKQSIAGSNVGYSWEILGDPALKVR